MGTRSSNLLLLFLLFKNSIAEKNEETSSYDDYLVSERGKITQSDTSTNELLESITSLLSNILDKRTGSDLNCMIRERVFKLLVHDSVV
jgi:hypothetical protein